MPLPGETSHDHCFFHCVSIPAPGKYTNLSDAYLSVLKSLQHACMEARVKLRLEWVEASDLEPEAKAAQPAKHEAWCVGRCGGTSGSG